MVEVETRDSCITGYDDNEAIRLFRADIITGKHWYLALLEAMRRWNIREETIEGRTYKYLIAGEAFDWLVLAERLCLAAEGMIPQVEKENLLFQGKAPLNLTEDEFQVLLGDIKYKQYLNYFYGITIEEALLFSVQEEIRKERMISIFRKGLDCENDAYMHIYGNSKKVLLKEFRSAQGYAQRESLGLTELKEFIYWLFKYRLEHCDRSRMASDTRKAMEFLKDQHIKMLRKNEST